MVESLTPRPLSVDPKMAGASSTNLPATLSHKRLSAVVAPSTTERSRVFEKRRNYYAVVRRGEGHQVGKIFESWQEAEIEIKAHANTGWKVFKTRLAAEAYVAKNLPAPSRDNLDVYDMQLDMDYGVIGSSSSSLGMPLHEHLARNFPSTPPLSSSSLPLAPPRPHFARSTKKRSGSGSSRLASPLRQEVIEEEPDWFSADDSAPATLQEPIALEPSAVPPVVTKPQRKSFFGSLKSASRSSLKTEKREQDTGTPMVNRDVIARPATSVQRPEDAASTLSRTKPNGRPPSDRPTTSSGAEHGRRPPSVRSVSAMSSHSSVDGRPRSATPAVAKSLWADSTVVDLSESESTKQQSPGKVYDEYPELPEVSPAGSGASTPKFSRSALKKSGITLPTAAPRSPSSSRGASPLGSPWHSPNSSKLSLGRSRSVLSLDASMFTKGRTSNCQSPESESEGSDYFGGFGQIRTHADVSTTPPPRAFRPNLRSKLSSSSLASSFSASTFRTAYESSTPPNESQTVDPTHTSSSTQSSHSLSPVMSNNSTSDGTHTYSESGTFSSDSPTSQASSVDNHCFGEPKVHAKKSGGMKRFLRMFGMTTRAGNPATAM
ncbi:hypothetical protein NliqN6_2412 [Naganishia liquefaciens]|uniref:Ribonuclease H1 N-terminal domain-containing protein n=1 Tax=Naganishia liquefaciens TaxID=104408 RepID=A0A8H3TSU1_9TREE|nr:hypothetical protein NliqN6_2412 [Naganishia liquefaciens]